MVVKAEDQGCRFILFAGKPLYEAVVRDGSIVMNTRQEPDTAFDELNRGTFTKQ